jgi:anti-sigma-K factor RskA
MSDISGGNDMDDEGIGAAEYALGLLPPAEREAFEARLRAEPALRTELAQWQARFAGLDAEFVETPAPPAVLKRLETRLFGAAPAAGWWESLRLWRGLAGAAVAVALIAIGLNIATPRPDPKAFAAELVAALSAQGSSVSLVALYDAQSGAVRLIGLSGAPVAGKDFELWAIEGSTAPRSMGVIPVVGSTELKPPRDLLKGFGEGTVLAITLEPKGGSPTGAPTGPIVAKGAATRI